MAELPERIGEAFQIATSGRPGPVVVVVPVDVAAAKFTEKKSVRKAIPPSIALNMEKGSLRSEQASALRNSAALINRARKPIIFAGQVVQASSTGLTALKQLAEKACIPVTTSLQGLGAFDEENQKSLHMVGLHGSGFANMAIQEADVVLALGARFDDRVTGDIAKFAPGALAAARQGCGGILHFEISPKNVNKVVQATEAIISDLGITLPLLLPKICPVQLRDDWFGKIVEWKR